jgi:hypothetical protein
MKKLFILLAISMITSLKINGQIDTSINGDLRKLILPLNRAACPAPFHYDMVAHVSDDRFYKPIVLDTTNTFNWRTMHFEMALASYAANILTSDTILSDQIDDVRRQDKVPLGLIDLDYNRFRTDAFDSINLGRWFFWNNDSIWDNPLRIDEPYDSNTVNPSRGTCHEVFSFSPLVETSHFRNVTFTIDPNTPFFFYNSAFSTNVLPHPTPHTFQIDFKDGFGWRTIDPFLYQEITIIYPIKGVYNPAARVIVDGIPIKFSISTFEVLTDNISRQPDFIIENELLNVGVFKACTDDSLLKPLIYLEGIDPPEFRNVPLIFDQMIRDETLIMLHNYQYDYVVVSWKNSIRDMKENAMAVVDLLDQLKTMSDTTHQFVMIGESMGGVIGRFALTFMETSAYQSKSPTDSALFKEHRLHNTRLFISLDAPHQGANIPLAVQQFNEWVYTVPRPLIRTAFFLSDLLRNTNISKNLLKHDAVRQLLIEHAHTRDAGGCYTHHAKRDTFMADLIAMNTATGGYPSQCKLVAMSNGLMDGSGQAGFNNRVIAANDRLLQLDYNLQVRIFRLIPIPLVHINDAVWRGNPNGSGNVINVPLRWNVFGRLRGCLTNIFRRNTSPCNILGIGLPYNLDVCNVEALDPMPGGKYPAASNFINSNTAANNSTLNIWIWKHMIDINPVTGNIFLRFQAGILYPTRMTLSGEADIADFCFIPIQSAFDYTGFDAGGNPLPQNHDILNTAVGTNLLRTPFHVIVGELTDNGCFPDPNGGAGCSNFAHLHMRNRQFTPGNGTTGALSWLTREIGEEEMRLDNMTIAREAKYQARNILNAGRDESVLYDYFNHGFTSGFGEDGMHSDSQRFIIDSFNIGEVRFTAGDSIRLRPGFESRRGSNFRARIEAVNVCVLTRDEIRDVFSAPFMQQDELNITEPEKIVGNLIIYPNPSNGSFTIAATNITSVKVFTLDGRLLYSERLSKVEKTSINKLDYSGLVIVETTTENGTFRNKLILNK